MHACQAPLDKLSGSIGLCRAEFHLVRKDHQSALDALTIVCEVNPGGNRMPEALFMMGICHSALKEEKRARECYGRILREFPLSPEAEQAKKRLERE